MADLIASAFARAFRKYVSDGVPSSGLHWPEKAEISALGILIENTISAVSAGLLPFETVAEMDAVTDQPEGALAYVWNNNGDADDPENGVYQWDGSAWEVATWYFTAVAAVIQPLLDANLAAVSAQAAAALASKVSAEAAAATLAPRFPSIYTSRSGVAWALIDKAKRRLRYISTLGVGYSNIPEVFNKAVTFVQRLTLTRVSLNGQGIDYLAFAGYRSGWVFAIVDSVKRVIIGVRTNGDLVVFGRKVGVPVSGWYGKKLAILSDSIGTASYGWAEQVAASLGATFTNYGLAGSRISDGGDTVKPAMCTTTRIDALATDIDLLMVLGGANDWAQNTPLGATTSTNVAEFYGGLNVMCSRLTTRLPTARIVLLATPFGGLSDWASRSGWTDAFTNSLGLTTRDYAEACRTAARRWGVKVIETDRMNVNTVNVFTIQPDGLHPTTAVAKANYRATVTGALVSIQPVS